MPFVAVRGSLNRAIRRTMYQVRPGGGGVSATVSLLASSATLGSWTGTTRSNEGTFTDHDGVIRTMPSGGQRIENARVVENLFTDTTTTLASGSATTAVNVEAGSFVFSMGAGSGTATFSGTATGSTGTLDADSSNRTAKALTITAAGTIIVTASVADLSNIQLQNKTGASDPTIPDDYVSAGVGTASISVDGSDFQDTADWNETAGWAVAGGECVATAAAVNSTCGQINAGDFVVGKTYEVTWRISSYTAGGCRIIIGGAGAGPGRQAVGTYTEVIVAADTKLTFQAQSSTFTGTIDLLSAKIADHGLGIDGVKAFNTDNSGTSVDGNGVVTEGTGVSLSGLSWLLEPSADNLLTYSEAFDNAAWGKILLAAVTSDVAISPDGTVTADELDLPSSAYLRQSVAISSSTSYTFSAWVKLAPSGSATHARVTSNNSLAWDTGGSTKVSLTSSWQRIETTWTSGAGDTNCFVIIGAIDETGTPDSDCVGKVLICGAQLEEVSTSTSYIKTEGSSAGRNADTAIQIAQTTPQSEGMAVAKLKLTTGRSNFGGNVSVMSFSSSNALTVMYQNTTQLVRTYDGVTPVSPATNAQGAKDDELVCAVRWSGSVMQCGYQLNSGAWNWSSEAVYDGGYVSDNTLNLLSLLHTPRNLEFAYLYDSDQGTSFIESEHGT